MVIRFSGEPLRYIRAVGVRAVTIILAAVSLLLLLGLAIAIAQWRKAARGHFIRTYSFPKAVFDKFAVKHPGLTLKERQLVGRGLRQFFLAYLHGGREFVSMPSQVADDLWHEFILNTREYEAFCRNAFGKFLHHTPAVSLGKDKDANTGLRRVWWQACREENINPAKATRLPLLFALDEKLKIRGGHHYALNSAELSREVEEDQSYVSSSSIDDFMDKAIDGSIDGFGDGGGVGDGGSDGGGCGGD